MGAGGRGVGEGGERNTTTYNVTTYTMMMVGTEPRKEYRAPHLTHPRPHRRGDRIQAMDVDQAVLTRCVRGEGGGGEDMQVCYVVCYVVFFGPNAS